MYHRKADAVLFFVVIAAMLIILLFFFGNLIIKTIGEKTKNTINVYIEYTDIGRGMFVLLSSKYSNISNMEILANSVVEGFNKTSLHDVEKTLDVMGLNYLGLNNKDIFGTRPDKVVFAEIPYPGVRSEKIGVEIA